MAAGEEVETTWGGVLMHFFRSLLHCGGFSVVGCCFFMLFWLSVIRDPFFLAYFVFCTTYRKLLLEGRHMGMHRTPNPTETVCMQLTL